MNGSDLKDLGRIINASETYTRLGGSRMKKEVREAMYAVSENFYDMHKFSELCCKRAAELTGNEAALIAPGAAACLMLASAALILAHDSSLAEDLPDMPETARNEILMFDGHYLDTTYYWHVSKAVGAKIVFAGKTVDEMLTYVNERTAGVILFPGKLYEGEDIPRCEESIPKLKAAGLLVAVDAAAQLPPVSNFTHYTKELGADLVIFSGGKHIAGPQASGLLLGRKDLVDLAKTVACPNDLVCRALKCGREEQAGLVKALELFIEEGDEPRYQRQHNYLNYIMTKLRLDLAERYELRSEGRLGTYQPLLVMELPKGKTGKDCNDFTRSFDPAVDIGFYNSGRHDGDPQLMFINAYNLREDELDYVADAVNAYLLS